MNAAAIFNYEAQPKERVERCNLCGSSEFVSLAKQDRYGFSARTDGCLNCGLVFLNPRMTKYAYARFYEGAYRALVSAYHGREINAETIQAEQKEYAEAISDFIWPHIKGHHTLLDVGGSTGVVARGLSAICGLRPTVLDPAPGELAYAQGIETISGLMEDYEPQGRTWDIITLCQTVDHLLDVMGTLRKIHACLAPGGLFFVDIVDYAKTQASKIDHPYNFTIDTMRACLFRSCFEPIRIESAGIHIRYLCERWH